MEDDAGGPKTYYRSEAPVNYGDYNSSDIPMQVHAHEKAAHDEYPVNGGHGAFEMQAVNAAELPAEGKTGGDQKVMNFYER